MRAREKYSGAEISRQLDNEVGTNERVEEEGFFFIAGGWIEIERVVGGQRQLGTMDRIRGLCHVTETMSDAFLAIVELIEFFAEVSGAKLIFSRPASPAPSRPLQFMK